MRLVIENSGSGVRWVVVNSEAEIAGEASRGRVKDQNSEFANGSQNPHFSQNRGEMGHPRSVVIPWIAAVVDPEWWKAQRADPKRLGEISQAAFLLKARQMGFGVAIPWGDSESQDFIVWAGHAGGNTGRSARGTQSLLRVQVKGTGRLHRRGYEIQPVRSTRGQGKKRYTKKDIDVLVGHVQPVDAWYVIPIEAVGRAKSLRLYPDIASRKPRWEQWRDRWDVLG